MRKTICLVVATVMGATAAWSATASAADRHVGYYYPEPGSREVYEARVPTLHDSDRLRRIGFVTVLTAQMLKNPYPPQFAIFAKGAEAEKLIVTGLSDNGYNTLFRARALFAMLTAMARSTQFFKEQPAADRYTFFDLAKLLGFEQITFTDGDAFAHQIVLE
ncbi:MAG: molybdopterin-guanine dinucleotide biosynthesis protein A [Alphaproteobacteria bacterium]|nr:molybdopterin-guanine dinucleotide biosynthesis protein A [Alphaproteobacteria bacterium]